MCSGVGKVRDRNPAAGNKQVLSLPDTGARGTCGATGNKGIQHRAGKPGQCADYGIIFLILVEGSINHVVLSQDAFFFPDLGQLCHDILHITLIVKCCRSDPRDFFKIPHVTMTTYVVLIHVTISGYHVFTRVRSNVALQQLLTRAQQTLLYPTGVALRHIRENYYYTRSTELVSCRKVPSIQQYPPYFNLVLFLVSV